MFIEKLNLADYFMTFSDEAISDEKGGFFVYHQKNLARKIENQMFIKGYSGAFSVFPTTKENVFYSGFFNADHTFSAINKITHENGVIKVYELDFYGVPFGMPHVFGF